MDAYIYKSDIYCEDCGEAIKSEFGAVLPLDSEDSNNYPQGPYTDGGGESDSPQHCGHCHEFLENPLTGDGYNYVIENIIHCMDSYKTSGPGYLDRVQEWAHYYELEYEEDPYFDRFDICEAYYLFASEYHQGQWSKEYTMFGRLNKIKFSPGVNLCYQSLNENARGIYVKLVLKECAE